MGPMGMAWANFLQLGGLVMAVALHRIAPKPFWALIRDLGFVYLVAVIPFTVIYWLDLGTAMRLAVCAPVGAAVVALYWWRFGAGWLSFLKRDS